MIKLLAAIYRANPVRPHCGNGSHVALCRLIVPRSKALTCGRDFGPSNDDFPF